MPTNVDAVAIAVAGHGLLLFESNTERSDTVCPNVLCDGDDDRGDDDDDGDAAA